MKRCSIESCESNIDATLQTTVTFFSFPKWEDADRFDKWVEALDKHPENFKHQNKYVCSKHFREEDLLLRRRTWPQTKINLSLQRQAVPSLFLSEDDKSRLSLTALNKRDEVLFEDCKPLDVTSIQRDKAEPDANSIGDLTDQKTETNDTKDNSLAVCNILIKEEVVTPESSTNESAQPPSTEEESAKQYPREGNEYKTKLSRRKEEETGVQSKAVTTQVELRENKSWNVEKKFICSECGERFFWAKEVRNHKLVSHGGVKCKFCRKKFVSLNSLRNHKRYRHLILQVYNCDECDEAFFNVKDFWNHLKDHSNSKKQKCPSCRKGFEGRAALESHNCVVARHLHCDICKRSFTSESTLQNHKKKFHLGRTLHPKAGAKGEENEKVVGVACDVCNCSFKSKKSLANHSRKHGKKKECEVCKKCYLAPGPLKMHKLTHLGVDCYNLGQIKW